MFVTNFGVVSLTCLFQLPFLFVTFLTHLRIISSGKSKQSAMNKTVKFLGQSWQEDTRTPSLLCTFLNLCQCNALKTRFLQSSQKTCSLHPLPTSFFAECLEQLLPAVTAIVSQSLKTGVFPSGFKEAIVKPLVKNRKKNKNS